MVVAVMCAATERLLRVGGVGWHECGVMVVAVMCVAVGWLLLRVGGEGCSQFSMVLVVLQLAEEVKWLLFCRSGRAGRA